LRSITTVELTVIEDLEATIRQIDQGLADLVASWRQIVERFMSADSRKDMARVNIYACEMAELRLIIKQVVKARLALEQMTKKLSFIPEGEEAHAMQALILAEVVNLVRSMIRFFSHSIEEELSGIESMLKAIADDTYRMGLSNMSSEDLNENARVIVESTTQIAEQEVKEKCKWPANPY